MTPVDVTTLTVMFFAAAVLYSAVGHAGASGYLAAMALVGVDQAVMKPTALTLNILVATIATVRFARAGAFSWALFWPFAIGATPFAFIGGRLTLPVEYYKPIVGVVLWFAAWRLALGSRPIEEPELKPPSYYVAVPIGVVIGLLSGLTGTGGGIFLSPVLVLMGWSSPKNAAGVSAAFILANSIAGLAGNWPDRAQWPEAMPIWLGAVAVGGFLGARLGSRRFGGLTLRRWLAAVLVVAGAKLVASPWS